MKPETIQYIHDKIKEFEDSLAEDKKLDLVLFEEISAREANTKQYPELSTWSVEDMKREGKHIMKRQALFNTTINILKEILEKESHAA